MIKKKKDFTFDFYFDIYISDKSLGLQTQAKLLLCFPHSIGQREKDWSRGKNEIHTIELSKIYTVLHIDSQSQGLLYQYQTRFLKIEILVFTFYKI